MCCYSKYRKWIQIQWYTGDDCQALMRWHIWKYLEFASASPPEQRWHAVPGTRTHSRWRVETKAQPVKLLLCYIWFNSHVVWRYDTLIIKWTSGHLSITPVWVMDSILLRLCVCRGDPVQAGCGFLTGWSCWLSRACSTSGSSAKMKLLRWI